MKNLDIERIRALKLFADMDMANFRDLTDESTILSIPASVPLFSEGDTLDFLYVLLDGSIEMQGQWNDKETTVAVARPVSVFILSSVILEASVLISARTLERSQILMLPAADIRSAMRKDCAFAVAVAGEMAGWNRAIVRQVKNLKLRTASERLANYLLQLRVKQSGAQTVHLPHEKRVLASLLGMTPENLSRAFATLGAYGVVVNGSDVALTDPRALYNIAKPSPFIDNHMPPLDHLGGKAERENWPPSDKNVKIIFD